MSRSIIFDAYEKIALERGIIKEAVATESKKDSPAVKKYKKSTSPRIGSDDISTIEALYGKQNDDAVLEYSQNISEYAHPNAVVIIPSYDRTRGVVFSPNQKQNFVINNIMGPSPEGNITQHKYAEQELIMELVRVANDLDAREMTDLQVLADACLAGMQKSADEKSTIEKVAFLPWLIGGAVILAATWLWNHADDPNNGIANNIARSLKALEALKTNSWYESNIDDAVKRDVEYLEKQLHEFNSKLALFRGAMNEFETVRGVPASAEAMVSLKDTADNHASTTAEELNEFVRAIDELYPKIVIAINNFTSSDYQSAHTEQSMLGSMTGWVGEALHGRYGLFANDFITAANTLGALKKSLADARGRAANIDEVKKEYLDNLNAQLEELKKDKASKGGAGSEKKNLFGNTPALGTPISAFQGSREKGLNSDLEDDVSMADDEIEGV